MSFFPLRNSEYTKSRCWLGLHPRPHWGSLQCFPDSLAGFKGATSQQKGNEGEGSEGLGKGEEGREEKGGMGEKS